jgi:hypothetical protein
VQQPNQSLLVVISFEELSRRVTPATKYSVVLSMSETIARVPRSRHKISSAYAPSAPSSRMDWLIPWALPGVEPSSNGA